MVNIRGSVERETQYDVNRTRTLRAHQGAGVPLERVSRKGKE
jgi:hypothetical protein